MVSIYNSIGELLNTKFNDKGIDQLKRSTFLIESTEQGG